MTTTEPSGAPGAEVVLHQERAEFDVERVAVRTVLRRRVVTEVRQLQVMVRREVLEVEQEATADPGAAGTRAEAEPLAIVLSEEVPVVLLEVRPYERVVATVHTITSEQQVSTTLGTEQADVETTAAPAP